MTTQSSTPVWLTRSEAAAYAGVDISTIDRWRRKGSLDTYTSGDRVRILREELDKLLAPVREKQTKEVQTL